jgi:predicted membrane chloride channel (bestrophin family)
VLRIQRGALDQLMSESLAQRLADAEPKVEDPRKLLSYAEVQSTLTDAVWSELRAGRDIDSLRRNLQREHLRRLTAALLRPTPAAATDVRPAHRAEALRLQAQLARASTSGSLNAVTRAHLNESLATLREALAAPLTRQGA